MTGMKRSFFGLAMIIAILVPAQSSAGPLTWLSNKLVPGQPKPEDPHVYPQGAMLYDMWTCKGENKFGWVGVTQEFTDRDPYILVVVRTEFDDSVGYREHIGVEIHAPRHNRIIAADRVILRRTQDVAFFYNPMALVRKGGYGEYRAVLMWDGFPRDEITFDLREAEVMPETDREESMAAADEQETAADLQAKNILGAPDVPAEEQETEEMFELGEQEKRMVIRDPRDRYRLDFENNEGEIIVFPKKARKSWQQNAKEDLEYRVSRYYVFL